MSFMLILILVGSGCLLLRESSATIYGTYNVFDHMGYPPPDSKPTSSPGTRTVQNTTIITKKSPAYYSPAIQTKQLSSPSSHIQAQTQQLHINATPQQQYHVQSPHPTEQPPMVTPSPLQAPQYEDAMARPFDSSLTGQGQQDQSVSLQSSNSATPAMTRIPLYLYNPSLARRLGISTFMMGSVLYGLSLLPALLAVGATSGVGPFAGIV